MSKTDPSRHLSRYEADANGCWIWQGVINVVTGYGQVGRDSYAHRVFYEAHKGAIAEGVTIDHLCRVRNCVNPDHLEAVTLRENILRSNNAAAMNARKTHCKRGHEFNEENTKVLRRGRACRTCMRAFYRKVADRRRKGIDRPIEYYIQNGARRYVRKSA